MAAALVFGLGAGAAGAQSARAKPAARTWTDVQWGFCLQVPPGWVQQRNAFGTMDGDFVVRLPGAASEAPAIVYFSGLNVRPSAVTGLPLTLAGDVLRGLPTDGTVVSVHHEFLFGYDAIWLDVIRQSTNGLVRDLTVETQRGSIFYYGSLEAPLVDWQIYEDEFDKVVAQNWKTGCVPPN